MRWLEPRTIRAARPTEDVTARMARAYTIAGRGDYAAALAPPGASP